MTRGRPLVIFTQKSKGPFHIDFCKDYRRCIHYRNDHLICLLAACINVIQWPPNMAQVAVSDDKLHVPSCKNSPPNWRGCSKLVTLVIITVSGALFSCREQFGVKIPMMIR